VPWAAACEIFHNATLVHDDLQDGDRLRRGEPTVWVRHGAAQAVNAGDLLLLLAFAAIAEVSAPAAVRAGLSAAMARLGSAVVAGQAAELVLLRSSRTQRQSYLETVTAKTSGLFELPVEGAALLCGHAPDAARRLGAAFRPLGILFQIQDDLLDLWGNKGREGPGSDLREGKVSALVVTHLERHPEDDDWLLALLRLPREQTPAAEMQRAIAAFEQGGARSETLAWMRALAAELGADPVLAGEARLLALAEELVAKVREPIAHLS
jgi:geranylgeranyl diphosphate synthase type I